jgi:thiol-disulfide isomerase/thioredoxin
VRIVLLLVIAACGQVAPVATPAVGIPEPVLGKVSEGRELVGRPAPSLQGISWTDGRSHPLGEDRGKVVLVRWWTDTCPFCANSAHALRALADAFGNDLRIRAIYHNKVAGRAVTAGDARAMAERVGYPWLVGQDGDGWPVLRRWWLGPGRRFTSVTFLLDQRGRIRALHTGGEFHARDQGTCVYDDPADCHREYEAMRQAIAALVAEP